MAAKQDDKPTQSHVVGFSNMIENDTDKAYATLGLTTPTGLDAFASLFTANLDKFEKGPNRLDLDRHDNAAVHAYVGDNGEPEFVLAVRDFENPKHPDDEMREYLDPALIETPVTIESLHEYQAQRFAANARMIVEAVAASTPTIEAMRAEAIRLSLAVSEATTDEHPRQAVTTYDTETAKDSMEAGAGLLADGFYSLAYRAREGDEDAAERLADEFDTLRMVEIPLGMIARGELGTKGGAS
jgi:hypothetical protein